MLILYLQEFNYWRHHKFVGSDQVNTLLVIGGSGGVPSEIRSDRVGSQKMDPWSFLVYSYRMVSSFLIDNI